MKTELAKKLEKAMQDHYVIYGKKELPGNDFKADDALDKHFEIYGRHKYMDRTIQIQK